MTEDNPYAPPRAELTNRIADASWDGTTSLAIATFRATWQGYLACFPRILGILALTYLPLNFLTAYYEFYHVSEDDWTSSFKISHLQNQWILLIPDGAIFWLGWNHAQGHYCGVAQCIGVALRRYWQLWWTRFLVGLSYLSLLLMVLPGIYLTTRWLMSEVMVLTDGAVGTRAFARSWEVTRTRFWRILGTTLLGITPALGLTAIPMAAWAFLPWKEWWIDGILESIVSLGLGFFLFLIPILYHHLRRMPPE